MAKTRAQRKAEKRRREQQAERERQARGGDGADRDAEARAQQRTQTPESGEVAEAEAVIETGARTEDYGEHVQEGPTEAPAPSRADVGLPDVEAAPEAPEAPGKAPRESREQRRERKKKEKEQRRRQREKEMQKAATGEKPEKRRGPVFGFLASCWAELKKVQWPDRDTLVQASAVTLIFVAIMAAYLGALDALFNWIVKQIL